MNSKNNKKDLFDPDFEVTYEDDPVFHYAEEPQENREFQNIDLKSQPKPPRSRQKKQKIQLPLQGDETILMNPISNGSVSSHPNQKPPQWEEEPDRYVPNVRNQILMIMRTAVPEERTPLLPEERLIFFPH